MSAVRLNSTQHLSNIRFDPATIARLAAQRDPQLSVRVDNARLMPRMSGVLDRAEAFAQAKAAFAGILGVPNLPAQRLTAYRNLDDPDLTRNAVGYERVDGELWGMNGPQLADVDQGALADCYFLAAVGSLVSRSPAEVRDMIRDNGDGTYSVRFWRSNEPVWITVDGSLPVDAAGNVEFAGVADSDGDGLVETWVAILEKAYAVYRDTYGKDNGRSGYADVGGTGHSDTVFRALVGGDPQRLTGLTEDEMVDTLSAVNDGHLVTVSTHSNAGGDGWVASHVYTVVGTVERDGETWVILRNPWGDGEPDDSDNMGVADDGLFAVRVSELATKDSRVYTTEPEYVPQIPQLDWIQV